MSLARELEREGLRDHSRELIAQVGEVWTAGVNVTSDPKRHTFMRPNIPDSLPIGLAHHWQGSAYGGSVT